MLRTVALAGMLILAPSLALAHNCPNLMGEIDAAMPSASLSDEDMARVQELRTEGQNLHEAGDHDASVEALEEAKSILGI
ncbi:hypothetical protein DDZ14_15135 [Maritimibacter sp. 55A14]|uniref:hypothetical protein n=1 Tax=Maritimibacter sp. 55A14 TaxID=2174844 RepID=UPI000D61E4AD|nr:hypothetical protein [Maritimibacter sp. 55A14]PWE30493.1 hypothetical protein DDZ14_15135 [Maritimibacter sp. 55A14]